MAELIGRGFVFDFLGAFVGFLGGLVYGFFGALFSGAAGVFGGGFGGVAGGLDVRFGAGVAGLLGVGVDGLLGGAAGFLGGFFGVGAGVLGVLFCAGVLREGNSRGEREYGECSENAIFHGFLSCEEILSAATLEMQSDSTVVRTIFRCS